MAQPTATRTFQSINGLKFHVTAFAKEKRGPRGKLKGYDKDTIIVSVLVGPSENEGLDIGATQVENNNADSGHTNEIWRNMQYIGARHLTDRKSLIDSAREAILEVNKDFTFPSNSR